MSFTGQHTHTRRLSCVVIFENLLCIFLAKEQHKICVYARHEGVFLASVYLASHACKPINHLTPPQTEIYSARARARNCQLNEAFVCALFRSLARLLSIIVRLKRERERKILISRPWRALNFVCALVHVLYMSCWILWRKFSLFFLKKTFSQAMTRQIVKFLVCVCVHANVNKKLADKTSGVNLHNCQIDCSFVRSFACSW